MSAYGHEWLRSLAFPQLTQVIGPGSGPTCPVNAAPPAAIGAQTAIRLPMVLSGAAKVQFGSQWLSGRVELDRERTPDHQPLAPWGRDRLDIPTAPKLRPMMCGFGVSSKRQYTAMPVSA